MKIIKNSTPSKNGEIMLNALTSAVSKNLEKKRKLGQYIVVWDGQKAVQKGADAPSADK